MGSTETKGIRGRERGWVVESRGLERERARLEMERKRGYYPGGSVKDLRSM